MARNPTADDEKVVQEAKDRFERCQAWEGTARARYVEDVKFTEGDSNNQYQWDPIIYRNRTAEQQPALTINKTRQHCLQVINDARQNKAQISIRPVGDGATYASAQILEGCVRHIEYQSNAMEAYDAATWHQVTGGIGYWRVVTDYVSDDSFDQEIYIKRQPDPLEVYLDPDIREFDGSDANFGFIFQDYAKDIFNSKYPNFVDDVRDAPLDNSWVSKDHVRVAEYFRKSIKADKLLALRMPDGTEKIVLESDIPPKIRKELKDEDIANERETTSPEIEWFKIVGGKVVERKIWPGIYIPIVRVVGEETVIDGQMDRKGHTRALKDAQRMYNFWTSGAAGQVALQTKVPYVTPIQAIEGLEDHWKNANRSNASYLPYNGIDDQGNKIEKPSREAPPVMSQAYIEGMRVAQMEMMMASGQYQAQFGENENAKSGVAIQQRQRQGDNATYHYIDHLAQAIRFTGRILIDLIPKIYDTERVIKIMAEDGDQSEVHIDPSAPQPHQMMIGDQPANEEQVKAAQANENLKDKVKTIFNPNLGRYDVEADVGPAFATRRQEAFNALTQMMAQNKELVGVAGDILFRVADFPMADELAERIKRTIRPDILGEGPPPALQEAQQQIQALQQALQQLSQQANDKGGDAKLKAYEAETRRMAALANADPDAMKPVVRGLVSDALQTPIMPLMDLHAQHDAMRASYGQQAEGEEGGEAPESQPLDADLVVQLLKVMAAPTEIIRDYQGRPVGSRKQLDFEPSHPLVKVMAAPKQLIFDDQNRPVAAQPVLQ